MRILFVHSVKESPWINSQVSYFQSKGCVIDSFIITKPKSFISLIKDGIKLRRLSKHYDIVQSQWGSTNGLLVSIVSYAPVIVTICGSDLLGNYRPDLKKNLKGSLSVISSKLSFYRASRIFVRSEVLKRAVQPQFHHKVEIIPNPVNINTFFPVDRRNAAETLGLDPFSFKMLFVSFGGNHVKNQPLAQKILEVLKRKNPDVELIYATKLTQKELNLYYNACNLLLITSFHEGSNNSLKEAMATNTPVISSRSGDAFERLSNVSNSMVFELIKYEEAISFIQEKLISERPHSNGREMLYSQGLTDDILYNKVVAIYKSLMIVKNGND